MQRITLETGSGFTRPRNFGRCHQGPRHATNHDPLSTPGVKVTGTSADSRRSAPRGSFTSCDGTLSTIVSRRSRARRLAWRDV